MFFLSLIITVSAMHWKSTVILFLFRYFDSYFHAWSHVTQNILHIALLLRIALNRKYFRKCHLFWFYGFALGNIFQWQSYFLCGRTENDDAQLYRSAFIAADKHPIKPDYPYPYYGHQVRVSSLSFRSEGRL